VETWYSIPISSYNLFFWRNVYVTVRSKPHTFQGRQYQ
jgi:hypothetical protein